MKVIIGKEATCIIDERGNEIHILNNLLKELCEMVTLVLQNKCKLELETIEFEI